MIIVQGKKILNNYLSYVNNNLNLYDHYKNNNDISSELK
jgi:hypothetical protein